MQAPAIRIGTRGSPLALAQAYEVQARLAAAHGIAAERIEIRIYKTAGDRILDRALAEVGGKGLFTKEIEDALLNGEVDVAVHSMKDMQTELPPGLVIGATLKREDVRDAFLSPSYASLAALPRGAIVGTSSLRRQAQVKRMRGDVQVVQFRGNVQTRLQKLKDGVAHATLLACAGLNRLGLTDQITARIPTEMMLPAVAQGAIGVEIRDGDGATARLVAPLDDPATATCVTAERAFLARLEGSCRTPIAGLAVIAEGVLDFRGEILTPDGTLHYATQRCGSPLDARILGDDAGAELLARAGPGFFTTAA